MSSYYRLIFSFFSVMMKLANTPHAVSTSSWLVILRKEQFVQTILAVMDVSLERYLSITNLVNNVKGIFCYGHDNVKHCMPEVALGNNKNCSSNNLSFIYLFIFLSND